MPENNEDRTEAATPRRRQQARERGQVARSADLNGVLILLGAVLFLRFYFPVLLRQLKLLFWLAWQDFSIKIDVGMVYPYTMKLFLYIIKMLGPIFLMMFILGLAVNILQVGVLFTGYPLIPKWERLNPVEGAKRLFSSRLFIQTLINLFKVLVVAWIIYSTLRGQLKDFVLLVDTPLGQSVVFWANLLYKVALKILLFLFVLAVMDYAYNRWEYEKSLRMTKEEIKEELKQMEGDPHIKARIRRVQRELAKQRMMKEVESADVVITNPTHVAVAVKYEPEKNTAPVVVAKGMRLLAERIKEIAMEHNVPIVENPVLARAIYKTVDVGETIPESLYKAVAEVLAYVYRLKNRVI